MVNIALIVVFVAFIIVICFKFTKADKEITVLQFTVKAAFVFGEHGMKVAMVTYYPEIEVYREAKEKGMNLKQYFDSMAPKFDFTTKPFTTDVMCAFDLPSRIIVPNEMVEKNDKIAVAINNLKCIYLLSKPENFSPYETYWIGMFIQTNDNNSYRSILKQFKKEFGKEVDHRY